MLNIEKYILPFVNKGADFKGADCYGLIRLIYKEERNIELPYHYVDATASREVYKLFVKDVGRWERINKNDVKEFDVVAMAYDLNHPNIVQHFGIAINNEQMLHSLENIGSHIAEIKDYEYCTKGFYRWQH